MNILSTPLPGVLLIEPDVFTDSRGLFFEAFHQDRYGTHGLPHNFVQDNFSRSKKNVLRGLHYQLENAQGKLVWVTQGEIFDVVVDVRRGSPHFGKFITMHLSAAKPQQIYIPPGFAHGFYSLSDEVHFHYKCTNYYFPKSERGIAWNDETLQIPWPVKNPLLSSKDECNLTLKQIPLTELPVYEK